MILEQRRAGIPAHAPLKAEAKAAQSMAGGDHTQKALSADVAESGQPKGTAEVARLEDLERIGTILEIMRYLLDTNNTNSAFLSIDLVL